MTNVSTVREALLAELLQDVDSLARRIETIDKTIASKIENSTKAAVGQAFLSAKLHFEQVITAQEHKLIEAGHYAAATIGNQMNKGATRLIGINEALERKAWHFIFVLAGFSLVAGLLGGIMGAIFVR